MDNTDELPQNLVPDSEQDRTNSSRKTLSLWSSILLLFGSIYGTGIYISVAITVACIPSIFYNLLMWLVGGLIALGAGLCYVELALLLPSCGGEYTYFNHAYHEIVGFSFMLSNFLFIRPISIAVSVLFMIEVICEAVLTEVPYWPTRLGSVGIVWLLFILHSVSNKYSIVLNNVLTYAKSIALFIIMGIAIYKLIKGQFENIKDWGFSANISPLLFGNGFYSVMWAYDGFNVLAYMVEEMKNISQIKIASIVAISGVTVVYILVNLSYIIIVGIQGLLDFKGVVKSIANPYLKQGSYVLMILLSLSALGSANGNAYSSSRFSFFDRRIYVDAARNHHLPFILAAIHKSRHTVIPSLFLQVIVD